MNTKRIMKKHTRGFTLIELLVVIAIIGILSSVVLASLNIARLKARNAKRREDLHQLQTALELFYSDNGSYPPQNINYVRTDLTSLAPKYISVLPSDPTYAGASSDYQYETYQGGYVLAAYIEGSASPYYCQIGNVKDTGGFNWTGTLPHC